MTNVEAWLADFGPPIDPGRLAGPAAKALIRFVERYAGHIAQLVATHKHDERELVVLDFRTGRPQQSTYPIKRTERLGVLFTASDSLPLVYTLRDDFPDTAHQQLAIEGAPRAICIDDRSWAEARLTWTPAELIQRTLSWFERAARGELHDARQPLDPVLFGSPLTFLISRRVLRESDQTDLIARHYPDHRTMLRVTTVEGARGPVGDLEQLCVVTYSIPPEHMRRLQFAPMNLGSLADMLSARGVDLLADLRGRFSRFLDQEAAWQLNARFAVILEMPIVAPDGRAQQGTDLRAFITERSVGEIAVALGIAMDQQRQDEGSGVGFVRALGLREIDQDAVRQIATPSAEVHLEFDRMLATRIARRDAPDDRRAVVVGAGAIGSHVADTLAREGRFEWTVIDHDRLLPHNLARHIGRSVSVTHSKAKIVAEALSGLVDAPQPIAHAIDVNVADDGERRAEIDDALERADIIIDATASLLAERYLSDHRAQARRASVFFNPSGDAAVLLAEPRGRSLTLRDLESQYLGHVAREPHLARHLTNDTQQFAYTGACRAITGMIPQSSVMALSGLVSAGLGAALDDDDATIKIWSMTDEGSVRCDSFAPEPVTRFVADDWTVVVDDGLISRVMNMRRSRLPNETGGVLFGVVDIPDKRIHLVEASPSPPDSIEETGGYTRGTQGVAELMESTRQKTQGQLGYVGEWHSHPPKATPLPSHTDLRQIDWLAALFDMDSQPALMLIASDHGISVVFKNIEAIASVPDGPAVRHAAGGGR